MSESGYTVRDTPGVVARIEADLDRVQTVVREGDPRLRSLVLTGGFARGEGAVVEGVPQNDYDLVAIRGPGGSRRSYARMRSELEAELGIHVDLAPVPVWRLPMVARSIFWYETALRSRVLWGEEMTRRIRVRDPAALDPAEGMRLLVNRAAGLLLATHFPDPHALRLQAAKAVLAGVDVQLLSVGRYCPSQSERMEEWSGIRREGVRLDGPSGLEDWAPWAFTFKVDPSSARGVSAWEAWRSAAQVLLEAVPVALRHAGCGSLEEYARRDTWADRVVWFARSGAIPGARRFVRHPTGRTRLATLQLLEASLDGGDLSDSARDHLDSLMPVKRDPLVALQRLRAATLQ